MVAGDVRLGRRARILAAIDKTAFAPIPPTPPPPFDGRNAASEHRGDRLLALAFGRVDDDQVSRPEVGVRRVSGRPQQTPTLLGHDLIRDDPISSPRPIGEFPDFSIPHCER